MLLLLLFLFLHFTLNPFETILTLKDEIIGQV